MSLNNIICSYDYEKICEETDNAWLLKIEKESGIEDTWFPKSQCTISENTMEINVPLWLADEKGLE